jgi:transcriptional regulator with XRE-family HTH domain
MSSFDHILPKHLRQLQNFGADIKLARLRRSLTADQVAERAGISRLTLLRVEAGTPTVSVGAYLQVLVVLGLETGLGTAASDDELGRKLQDLGLAARKRVSSGRRKRKQ